MIKSVWDENTGKQADLNALRKEDWVKQHLGTKLEWAITIDGEILLVDSCGNWVYAPYPRFLLRIHDC